MPFYKKGAHLIILLEAGDLLFFGFVATAVTWVLCGVVVTWVLFAECSGFSLYLPAFSPFDSPILQAV